MLKLVIPLGYFNRQELKEIAEIGKNLIVELRIEYLVDQELEKENLINKLIRDVTK